MLQKKNEEKDRIHIGASTHKQSDNFFINVMIFFVLVYAGSLNAILEILDF